MTGLIWLVAVVALSADPARAQSSLAQSGALPVTTGQEVWVQRDDRSEVHGSVFHLSHTALTLVTDTGLVEIPFRQITRVQVPGPASTTKGAVLGGLIGGVVMGTLVAIDGAQCDDRQAIVCFSGPGWVAGGAVVGAGLGALAGGTIGSRLRSRKTIYPTPRRKSPALLMTPVVTAKSASIAGTIRW